MKMESDRLFSRADEEIQHLKNNQNNNDNQKNSSESIPKNFSESNFFKKFFYLWVNPAIKLANIRPLENKDVSNIGSDQRTIKNLSLYQQIFSKLSSNKNSKYPLFFSILYLHYKYFLFIYFLFIIDLSIVYAKIYFFKRIISIFSRGDFFPEHNFSFYEIRKFKFNIVESIVFFIFFKLIGSYNYNYILLQNAILNRKIIHETCGLLIEKLLKTNSINSSFAKGEGEKLNMLEVDVEKIGYFFLWFPRISIYPFKISFSLYLLFKIFGKRYTYAILTLIGVIIIIVFFQLIYNRNLKYVLHSKDKRMKIVTYVFTVLKNLKIDNLDDEFIERIDEKRNGEISMIRKQFNLEIIIGVLNKNLNLILSILTLNLFVNSKDGLEISTLFTSLQLINTITGPLTVVPIFLSRIASNLISMKRLQAFLLSEEHFNNQNIIEEKNNIIAIKFDNTTFGINNIKQNNDINTNVYLDLNPELYEKEEIKLLENISFSVKKGEFIGIAGNTGSGKTCLLNAIMNNYNILSSNSNPEINGEISFCPSHPWLMTESIKNNIIFFGEKKDKKYKEILSLCQLKKDLEKLYEGDETIVNSTCSNISEGQKIRICLARCLYQNVNIYLVDDIFSNLDNNISLKIFQGVFVNYLKNKTRILVISRKKFLSFVDKIIYLEKGKITFFGNYEQFKEFNKEIIDNKNEEDLDEKEEEKENKEQDLNESKKQEKYKDIIFTGYENPNDMLNSISRNNVPYKTYLNYIKLQGGYSLFFSLILLITVVKILEIYRNTIIPSLAKSYKEISKAQKSKETNEIFMINLKKNFLIFFRISLGTIFLNFVIRFITTRITLYSMKVVHRKMIYRLIKAPINLFHDVVPVGQILNRLTRDVGIIESIIRTVNSFIKLLFSLVSCMILCYIYNKTIVYYSPVIVIYAIILTGYYIKAGRNLTRLYRISYSPIMTIFSESIRGIDIIRTCHVEENTRDKFLEKLDERYGIHLYSEGCRRWIAIRRSSFISLTFGIIILHMAYHPEYYSVRAIAVILQYTEEFLAHLMNTSLFYMDLENNMIGLERCEQILKIEIEKDTHNIIDLKIDKNWPTKGEIKFVNYRASYRPNTPEILKNINIKIKAREKVGIVGRTGSGKSSLMNALARIIEPKSGHIFIDGTDIQNISLKTIREKISILPQELFLIESTLRDNIDPLKKHSDEEILTMCKELSLFPYLNDDDKLNFEIKENGKNLSTGEKKLICFARTIIRNNKIVILDEPTGALDNEIKEIINENIGNLLKDATVIIITSQVEMLKQCERIIVIDNGEIAEIGEYSELIKNKKSLLYSLFLK